MTDTSLRYAFFASMKVYHNVRRMSIVKKQMLICARNLRRTIQRELEDPISEKIIDSFESPICEIFLHAEDDCIHLEVK